MTREIFETINRMRKQALEVFTDRTFEDIYGMLKSGKCIIIKLGADFRVSVTWNVDDEDHKKSLEPYRQHAADQKPPSGP